MHIISSLLIWILEKLIVYQCSEGRDIDDNANGNGNIDNNEEDHNAVRTVLIALIMTNH